MFLSLLHVLHVLDLFLALTTCNLMFMFFQSQEKKLLRMKYRRKFSRVSAIALESESTSPAD